MGQQEMWNKLAANSNNIFTVYLIIYEFVQTEVGLIKAIPGRTTGIPILSVIGPVAKLFNVHDIHSSPTQNTINVSNSIQSLLLQG